MAKNPKNRAEQAKKILKLAEKRGVQSNFFFATTFERYQTQLGILDALESAIEEDGVIVSKEYVKGRQNLYSNPAVTEFNRTTDSANKTVSTLLRIINDFGVREDDGEEDPLMRMINGED